MFTPIKKGKGLIMKILITGSREFNESKIDRVLTYFEENNVSTNDLVINPDYKGFDQIIKQICKDKGIPFEERQPIFDRHGKQADLINNKAIVKECDKAIIFFNQKSRNIKEIIDLCNKKKAIDSKFKFNVYVLG